MPILETVVRLVVGVGLLLTNAFFVATEFALTRLRQYDRDEIEDHAGLRKAWEMTETLEIYLTSCQIGITTTSILLGVITEPAVTLLIEGLLGGVTLGSVSSHAISITLAVVVINFCHTVWGEQTPTYLGVERAKTVAKYCAHLHYWWTRLVYPILYLGDRITKGTLRVFGIEMKRSWLKEEEGKGEPTHAEMREEIASVLKTGGLPSERREEVVKALEIDEISLKEIMVPREEIVSLSTRIPIEENIERVKKSLHVRYPLVGDSLEDFKRILYTPEVLGNIQPLLEGEKVLDDFDRSRLLLPSHTSVSDTIDCFQAERQELALVVEDEKVVGLVTLTDALETIVGSAEDPLDQTVQTLKEGSKTKPEGE